MLHYSMNMVSMVRTTGHSLTHPDLTKLSASDAEPFDRFGWWVSVSGDIALIGAPFDDDLGERAGSAYVFRFNGIEWIEEA